MPFVFDWIMAQPRKDIRLCKGYISQNSNLMYDIIYDIMNCMISCMISYKFRQYHNRNHIWYHTKNYDIMYDIIVSAFLALYDIVRKLWYHTWYHKIFFDIIHDIIVSDNIMQISAFLALFSYGFDYVIIAISPCFGYDINNLWFWLWFRLWYTLWYQQLPIS